MAIVITKQPADFVCTVNETAIFTFEATGVTKYQWQCLGNSGYWNNLSWSGYNTATMTRALNMNNINYQYRCELTDADGNKMYTRTVRVIEPTDDIGGLVNASTLHAIAEAIRAKTETTDKILPADMAGLIEGIEAGSAQVVTGELTVSTQTQSPINLGASLPITDNYAFVIFGGDTPTSAGSLLYVQDYCLVHINEGIHVGGIYAQGKSTSVTYKARLTNTSYSIDADAGTCTLPSSANVNSFNHTIYFKGTYAWVYIAW